VGVYYRPGTQQSGCQLWIGELGSNVQSFLQRLMGRLLSSGGCVGLPEGTEKMGPIGTDSCQKESERATRDVACFLEATSPDEGRG
jgi:hypothetical protein